VSEYIACTGVLREVTNAGRFTMIRALAVPFALAAVAFTAAPASAGLLSSPLGVSASAVANHTEGTVYVMSRKQLTAKATIIDGRHR
jgi:hypothetical protein